MKISTTHAATTYATSSVMIDKYDGCFNANLELGEDIVLEDAEGHPTIYASPELSKAILSFLTAL